ncbi:MAG: HPr(Ser) kinase/phosphatase [Oscillospiraceae bacterium]|jgi:HPr kinase/phosphorylase|nr:HPr(Ser) kinase/phosphatase [Oscillospiraceae bacterium]
MEPQQLPGQPQPQPQYTINLTKLIEEFGLAVLTAPDNLGDIKIYSDDVNRPGLQLAGFFAHFESTRIQMMGNVETYYLKSLDDESRRLSFERFMGKDFPALIFSRGIEPFDECIATARKYNKPVLQSPEPTSYLMSALIAYLKLQLAPRITMHGVLVEVYGEGILLLGDSGVGKSETAIELVKRGHRLIADDAVDIKKVSAISLVGSAPELIRHYIELRGIGVVDVRHIFGMGAIKPTERIELVINLEAWKDETVYDRLGMDEKTVTIMDVQLPSLTIPVKPGRNLAVIIEVAAMNNRHKKLGFNAARDFSGQIDRFFEEKAAQGML